MRVPTSPHFAAVPLTGVFNTRRSDLPEPLATPATFECWKDETIRGIPFAFGAPGEDDVVLLDTETVR
ncbi:MAG: hypothetical protein M3141_07530, partial [Actinomycetota bacterium]|nr:hypothetical protein [Actinomycetota bacterium]